MDFLSFLINSIPALGIAFSLFCALTHLFNWEYRYGWTILISNTSSKLTGKFLRQYQLCQVLSSLLFAICFFLCFFDSLSAVRTALLGLELALCIGVEVHFSKIAKD